MAARYIPANRGALFVLAATLTIAVIGSACNNDRVVAPRESAAPVKGRYALVPTTPPDGISDSVWAAIGDSSNIFWNSAGFPMPVVKNTLIIKFKNTATLLQKQAIVDSIPAQVVGGTPFSPAYYVEFTDPTPVNVDSAASRLMRRLDSLKRNAFVASVNIHVLGLGQLTYLKPMEAATWSSHWSLSPDSASHAYSNWAVEAVDAPRAWGCSIGSKATRVAVLDYGFTDLADLHDNLGSVAEISSSDTVKHGTWVSSIIGAVGNNGTGIAGMMWSVDLDLVSAFKKDGSTPHGFEQVANLIRAGETGARVINMSIASYYGAAGYTAPPHTDRDSASLNALVDGYVTALREIHRANYDPLFVFSASNDGIDASWNPSANLADSAEFAGHVLVVGAFGVGSPGQYHLWDDGFGSGSNRGHLVSVVAPGVDVTTLDADGSLVQKTGTSLAAPFVTGIAAELFDFDPRLSADSVKTLIIAGAVAGKRSVADPSLPARPIPMINAYESLKLAAKRSGAPLCGDQRIYVDNSNLHLYVVRDSGATPQTLTVLDQLAWDVDVFHGGKHIQWATATGDGHLAFSGTGWATTDDYDYDDMPSGSWMSQHGWSHYDGYLYFMHPIIHDPRYADGIPADTEYIRIHRGQANYSEDSLTIPFYAGFDNTVKSSTWSVGFAYPTIGDTALVAIARGKRIVTKDSTWQCHDDRNVPATCHDTTFAISPDTTYLYSMNVHSATPSLHLLRKMADTIVFNIGFSETGKQTVVTAGSDSYIAHTGVSDRDSHVTNWCDAIYSNSHFVGAQRTVDIPACPDWQDHVNFVGGGFSPNRIPGRSGQQDAGKVLRARIQEMRSGHRKIAKFEF